MKITMNYGREGLELDLPDSWDITLINKKTMPVAPNPQKAVQRALGEPVGCRPLVEEARGKNGACILICDVTRPVPNGLILPVLVNQLIEAGMGVDRIRILVATGLHRPTKEAELKEVIGDEWVFENILIENHYACNDEDHVSLGRSSRGTPIKLDRRLVETDLRIAVGLVESHFMAGYSGGRKIIAPGLAHHDTITRLHTTTFLDHPKAAYSLPAISFRKPSTPSLMSLLWASTYSAEPMPSEISEIMKRSPPGSSISWAPTMPLTVW